MGNANYLITNAMRGDQQILEQFEGRAQEVVELTDYVWCEVRGDVHDIVYSGGTEHRRLGVVYHDIYQDGTICCDADHKPIYTTGEVD